MREKFFEELEKEMNEKELEEERKEKIRSTYIKRYDFGLEAGLSEEKIEQMLGNPKEIVESYLFPLAKIAEPIDFEIDVSLVADSIEFMVSEDTDFHINRENIKEEYYEFEQTDKKLKINYLKRKVFHLDKKNKGKITVFLPMNMIFSKVKIFSVSGDIDISNMKATDLMVNTISGNCRFHTIESDMVYWKVISGDIKGETLKTKNVRIDSISGDTEIRFVVADYAQLDTISGDVDFESATLGNASSTTVSGNIKINSEENGVNVVQSLKGLFRK